MEMQKKFQGTFGMTIDKQNRIWFIEPASFDFAHTRLWAFDLQTRQQVLFFEFPGNTAQFAQDLRVTADGKYVLLADTGAFSFTSPKLYVFSVENRTFRVALDGASASCIQAENWLMQTTYGPYRLFWGLVNFSAGLDGIEISEDQNWVYLAPMTSSRLCRVPLSAVLDPNLKPSDLAQKVEDIGKKPFNDGITIDKAGHIILTDVEHGGLMAFDLESKKVSVLVRSKDVIWPDGVVTGPDGSLYFTDSAIPSYIGQFSAAPDKSTLLDHRPYYIYRVR
jgi:sugar lactone lactonase YvrE